VVLVYLVLLAMRLLGWVARANHARPVRLRSLLVRALVVQPVSRQ